MSTETQACYFCDCEAKRSDNRRSHCRAKHTAESVTGFVLFNGLKFRHDVERSNLVISLKSEGSKQNFGYCFDCYTEIPVMNGTPNPLGRIQAHSCCERKPRKKSDGTPKMAASAPTVSLRVTEEDLLRFRDTVLKFDMEYKDDTDTLEVDLRKSFNNFLQAIKTVKTAAETPVTASYRAIVNQIQLAVAAKNPKRRAEVKAYITKELEMAQSYVDSDDEDGFDEEAELQNVLVAALLNTIDQQKQAKETSKISPREIDLEQENSTLRQEMSLLTDKYNTLLSHYEALIKPSGKDIIEHSN